MSKPVRGGRCAFAPMEGAGTPRVRECVPVDPKMRHVNVAGRTLAYTDSLGFNLAGENPYRCNNCGCVFVPTVVELEEKD